MNVVLMLLVTLVGGALGALATSAWLNRGDHAHRRSREVMQSQAMRSLGDLAVSRGVPPAVVAALLADGDWVMPDLDATEVMDLSGLRMADQDGPAHRQPRAHPGQELTGDMFPTVAMPILPARSGPGMPVGLASAGPGAPARSAPARSAPVAPAPAADGAAAALLAGATTAAIPVLSTPAGPAGAPAAPGQASNSGQATTAGVPVRPGPGGPPVPRSVLSGTVLSGPSRLSPVGGEQ